MFHKSVFNSAHLCRNSASIIFLTFENRDEIVMNTTTDFTYYKNHIKYLSKEPKKNLAALIVHEIWSPIAGKIDYFVRAC